jgi:hypothetical protein
MVSCLDWRLVDSAHPRVNQGFLPLAQIECTPIQCHATATICTSNTAANCERITGLTCSTEIPGQNCARLPTGLWAMPQGTMYSNPLRSGQTLRAKPCIVIQRLTLMPMAASLRSPTQTPVTPGRRSPWTRQNRPESESITSSSWRRYQCRSWLMALQVQNRDSPPVARDNDGSLLPPAQCETKDRSWPGVKT